jgi:hypothetical protein
MAKGDYPAELNIPLPFSLISNDISNSQLVIMPCYWFMYNMYALARNSAKYVDRDKRTKKIQHIEYDYLAPDSVNEIFTALQLLRRFTAKSLNKEWKDEKVLAMEGDRLLNDASLDFKKVQVHAEGFESGNRTVQIIKIKEAYTIYKQLIIYYAVEQLVLFSNRQSFSSFEAFRQALPQTPVRKDWVNVGGQLLTKISMQDLLGKIRKGDIKSWNEVHQFYQQHGIAYTEQKLHHAFASLLELLEIEPDRFTPDLFASLLQQAAATKTWMVENIYSSRAKDFDNDFRQMVYDNEAEMESVIGKLDDNVFIQQQQEELAVFKERLETVSNRLGLYTKAGF